MSREPTLHLGETINLADLVVDGEITDHVFDQCEITSPFTLIEGVVDGPGIRLRRTLFNNCRISFAKGLDVCVRTGASGLSSFSGNMLTNAPLR